jgi:hypothetical protein
VDANGPVCRNRLKHLFVGLAAVVALAGALRGHREDRRWQRSLLALGIARFVALFSTGLLAGLLFDFWAFITPAPATLPGLTFVAVTQAIDLQFLVPIVFIYLVVDLSGLAVVLLLLRQRGSPLFALSTVALVGTLLGTPRLCSSTCRST